MDEMKLTSKSTIYLPLTGNAELRLVSLQFCWKLIGGISHLHSGEILISNHPV